MARIKYVLNERRRAAIEAGQILARDRQEKGLSPDRFDERSLGARQLYDALPTPKLRREKRQRPVKTRPKVVTKAQRAAANERASKMLATFLKGRKEGRAGPEQSFVGSGPATIRTVEAPV
jgi:hypothetical protein